LREARRSDGICGKSSEGGWGGPTVAHATSINGALKASADISAERLMRKKTD
jgi:hypothetical protein